MARPWWVHVVRGLIVLTAIAEMVRGDVLYGVFCLIAVGVTLVPSLLARDLHARTPVELEVALLLLMVGDMTFGNLLGWYVRLPWYDKVVHVGSSILVGLIGFLSIYVLHATDRVRFRPWLDGVAIFLATVGIGAVWEIAEYAADHLFGRATQGSPTMAPIDDTMIDLMLDSIGGIVAAVFGPVYMRCSARSRRRVGELVELISRRAERGTHAG
ncbi:MAG: hypothetical protein H6Q90_7020 [Deltaproteobacteria bacterium]|nr:hypothetical protein [Deltaproteobacteria bacterium]